MRLSIVTPSLNQGKYIERTIKSVLDQNYPDLEYWVTDGGSTDETLDILRRYEDRLHWLSEKDKGQSDAVNKGWTRCTGEVVGWTNSDDTYEPGSFEKVMRVFREHPEVEMVCGDMQVIDEEGYPLRRFVGGPFNARNHIRMGVCAVYNQSVFWRKSLLDRVGYLDTTLRYSMDYDLFCRMEGVKTYYISEVLGNYRFQPESITCTVRPKMIKESRSVRRRYMKTGTDVLMSRYWDFRVNLYSLLEPYLLRRRGAPTRAG